MWLARALVTASVFFVLACHGRWVPNAPVTIYGRNEAESFERTLKILRDGSYQIAEQSPESGHLKVWAKTRRLPTDNGKGPLDRASWFVFRIDAEGDVRITAHGYHVRDGNSVRKHDLDEELDNLEQALKRELDASGN